MNKDINSTENEQSKISVVVNSLGIPKTIGELKELIKDYPDEIPFGFRNQQMQELYEVRYPNIMFVVFQ